MFHISIFRFINLVVVSSTIAAVGLSFYSYGFLLVGTCPDISAVQILVVIEFCLVSLLNSDSYFVYGIDHYIVQTYFVEPGRMKHCQVNTSDTMKSPPWFRFPYPL